MEYSIISQDRIPVEEQRPVPLSDLTIDTFFILRNAFFGADGTALPFTLRDKQNTQDDPLDAYIAQLLARDLHDATCLKSPGPLISPDMVLYRAACQQMSSAALKQDPSRIVALEVKKLGRERSGQVARSTGLDYNTTPPCGTVRVYDADDKPLDIRSFYLFVCQEKAGEDRYMLTALTLCDGYALNADFKLYLSITGQRQKGTGLGTYGDGINRERPMLVFANPLGAAQLDRSITLIHQADAMVEVDPRLGLVYEIGRTIPEGGEGLFFAYRSVGDIPSGWEAQRLLNPFPQPINRVSGTQARGKFRLPIRPVQE